MLDCSGVAKVPQASQFQRSADKLDASLPRREDDSPHAAARAQSRARLASRSAHVPVIANDTPSRLPVIQILGGAHASYPKC